MKKLFDRFFGDDAPEITGFDAEDIERAWTDAKKLWGEHVMLSAPEPLATSSTGDHWSSDEPLAFIDLQTRQVVVNYVLLDAIGAADSLTAVLAHEIGHHVAFPRTLGELATLQVMERQLLPGFPGSLVNLFLDLQVNEVVGRTWADALIAVYRGFNDHQAPPLNPIFSFYLAIYECLWGLDEPYLLNRSNAEFMDTTFPAWRADARMFTQTFYGLNDTYLQFAYFCGVFFRYIRAASMVQDYPRPVIPLGDDVPDPSTEDYTGAIRALKEGRAQAAIDEAQDRGWIDEVVGEDLLDAFELIDGLISAGHGRGVAEFRRKLSEREYAHLVDRHLIELPDTEEPLEGPMIPQTLESWEPGDDPRSIDWVASVMVRGPLAAAMPMKRLLARDDGGDSDGGATALEIYLDTSGSMPDPTMRFNAMTLAAQILSAAAIRSGGRVRAAIYSDGDPLVSKWMYDESWARQFLLQYAGGGTYFPFERLRKWAGEPLEVIRVIISDHGFIHDLTRKDGPDAVLYAAERSELMVVLLLGGHPIIEELHNTSKAVHSHRRIRPVGVKELDDLAGVARRLADALYST